MDIINFLRLLPAIIIPLACGLLAQAWFLARDTDSPLIERIVLGLGLGLGFLSFEIFILGALEVRFSVFTITLVQVVFFISLLINYWISGALSLRAVFGDSIIGPEPEGAGRCEGSSSLVSFWSALKPYATVFMALYLAIRLVFVLDECLARPIFSIDAWGHWASGAKFFFYERGFYLNPDKWNYFGRGYRVELGYPLHLSLIEMWSALWIGQFHEVFVKFWSALYFIMISVFFFSVVRREAGRFSALVWVFFLTSAPLLVYHGIEGLADLPLAFYSFAAVAFFWRYLKREDIRFLMLAGLLLGMAMCAKYEGIFFSSALMLALCVAVAFKRRRPVTALAAFLIPIFIIVGPWLVYKKINHMSLTHNNAEARLVALMKRRAGLSKDRARPGAPAHIQQEKGTTKAQVEKKRTVRIHTEILGDIFVKLSTSANYNLIFAFWLVFTIIGIKEVLRSDLKYLYIIELTVLSLFVALYLAVVPEVVTEDTAIYRNALTYMPLFYFSSALLINALSGIDPSGAKITIDKS